MLRQLIEANRIPEAIQNSFRREWLPVNVLEFEQYFQDLEQKGQYASLVSLAQQIPEESPVAFEAFYALARAYANLGDVLAADRFLRKALHHAMLHKDLLTHALGGRSLFPGYVLQQAVYIDTTLSLSTNSRVFPNVPTSCDHENDHHFVVVSCNGLYLERYGERFFATLKSLSDSFHVHLYLCDPLDDSLALVEKFQGLLGKSIVVHVEENLNNLVSLTCRRFQVLPQLMRAHRGHALVTDIDVEFTDVFPQMIHDLPHGSGAGLFEFKHVAPMLICHCSLSYFHNDRAGQAFTALLASYLDQKLAEESRLWTLDQCGLFVVSRLLRQGKLSEVSPSEFTWWNLTDVLQYPLLRVQQDQRSPSAEKVALRKKVDDGAFTMRDSFEIQFTPDLRPKLSWKEKSS